VELIDLPGVYSLSPHSEDEQVAYDVLTGRAPTRPSPKPSCWCSIRPTWRRHLMLAAPILALGLPTLVILNMADDLRSRGGTRGSRKALARSWACRWRW
jgi:ferrous iron transport protein B